MGANTITKIGNVIEIVPNDSWDENWSCTVDLGWPDGMFLHSIVFKGGTAGDILIVLNSKTETATEHAARIRAGKDRRRAAALRDLRASKPSRDLRAAWDAKENR